MPNKKTHQKKNSTNPVTNQLLILLLFNDLTNIHLLLQQQQNQIKALSKAAMQQQEVKKFCLFNSSAYFCKK